jgi:GTP-binding protein HflX
LLLHVVDISHPEFEDHIASVNQTLLDIKANDKPVIMVSIRLMPIPLTIDEDDLMTEKNHDTFTLEEWKSTWMSRVGRKRFVYFGNK